MKKTNLIKGILLILLSIVLIGTTGVYAANDLSSGLDEELLNLTDSGNSTKKDNTEKDNNIIENNNVNNSVNNNVNNNKSSIYNNVNNTTNNTNLPKTGIGDSIPTMVLVVVFGISAIYAYKKIKEYNNI